MILFDSSTFVSTVCNLLIFELFLFLPPASKNTNKQHAVTQMRSSAVTWHVRELFSNSGSGEEEEGKNAATGAIFTIQFMMFHRRRACWAVEAAASVRLLHECVAKDLTGSARTGLPCLSPHEWNNDWKSLVNLLEQTWKISLRKLTEQ